MKSVWCWAMASLSMLTSFTSNVCRPLVLKSKPLWGRTETKAKRSRPESSVSLFGSWGENRSSRSSTSWATTSFLQSMPMSLMKHAWLMFPTTSQMLSRKGRSTTVEVWRINVLGIVMSSKRRLPTACALLREAEIEEVR